MIFYKFLTIFFIALLMFIPIQIGAHLNYIISIFALLLLPIFLKNIKQASIPFVLFLIACAISTIFSIDQSKSIPQLILYHAYFVIFISIKSIFSTEKSKEYLLGAFLSIVSVLSIISLYNTFFLHLVNRIEKGISFMYLYWGHNHLSALLVFAIPISFYFLGKYWNRKYLNVLLFIASYFFLFTLFFCFSLGSLISLGLATLIILFLRKNALKEKILLTLMAVFLFSITFLGALNLRDGLNLNSIFGLKKSLPSSGNARLVYWEQAFDNFKKNPLFGSGLKTFQIVNAKFPAKTTKALPTDSVHNFFLQMLSDAGILGFITSLILISAVIWQGIKKLKTPLGTALFAGVLASTFNTFVDFDWQIATVFLIFWIMAGLITSNQETD